MSFLICKGGYVFGSVGLSVCLFVCLSEDNITQKSYERIGVKFNGGVLGSTNEELIKFWRWSGYSKMSKWAMCYKVQIELMSFSINFR